MTESSLIIAIVAVIIACAALAAMAIVLLRSREPAPAEDPALSDLTRAQAEAAARLEGADQACWPTASRSFSPRGQRAAGFGFAPARQFAGKDQAEHRRKSAKARRAACGDRPGAEEYHRPRQPGDVAAGRARQQTVARRVRPMADGSHRAGRSAERRLCVPAHARQPDPSRLLRVPARPAPAGDRRQISAGSHHRLS